MSEEKQQMQELTLDLIYSLPMNQRKIALKKWHMYLEDKRKESKELTLFEKKVKDSFRRRVRRQREQESVESSEEKNELIDDGFVIRGAF